MKFDSNRAWLEAAGAIRANREVLFALAGVFFMLPTLAFSLLFPQPEPPGGLQGEAALKFLSEYYASTLPFMIPMAILQAAGTLALLTLLTDRTRPTVGQAIREGFTSLLPYFAAQLLLGFAIGIVAGVILLVAGITQSAVVAVVAFVAVVVGVIYAAVKTSLVGPVVAVERVRNPVHALTRSWELTKGNSLRIFAFYLLVVVAFGLVLAIIMGIIGLTLAFVLSTQMAKVLAAIVSSALTAVMALYFVGIIASVHRQLAGPTAETISTTFE
jgi:hypothetical protein